MPEMLTVHHLPEVFGTGGIFADQQLRDVLDGTDDGARVPFESGLAPADEARLIRDHLDEDPVPHPRVADEGFDAFDFHGEEI